MTSDVSGIVIAIQGNLVSSATPTTNQVLEWDGSEWAPTNLPSALPPNGSAGGDLGGSYPNPSVLKANGASVPAAGTLTTGNVLQVSGTSVLSYGAVNLAGGSAYVSGVLPAGNQADQSVGGDLSGSTSSASIVSISGSSVISTSSNKLSLLKGQNVSVSALKTSNYTVLASDYIVGIGTLTSTITITLPASPSTGDIYVIKDVNGTAGNPYSVLIDGNSVAIDGFGTSGFMLNVIYKAVTIVFTGTIWSII